jgi:hypothetical protein
LDFPAYQLLYGITFFYITEEDMAKRNIPEKDRKTITKVDYLNKVIISTMTYQGPELSEPDVSPLH